MYSNPGIVGKNCGRKFPKTFCFNIWLPYYHSYRSGVNFESDLFKAFCTCLDVSKTRTTPYYPASNGAIERQNRTVLQMIRCYILDNIKDWDKDLPIITMALHSMINKATGFSANMIMLGREVFQPADLLLGTISEKLKSVSTSQWVSELAHKMSKIHHLVRRNLNLSQAIQKCDYDVRQRETLYEIGDFVYKLEKSLKKGISPKLQPVWRGPYLIVQSKHPLYKIRTRNSKCDKFIHHNNLKRCTDRVIPLWLRRARNNLWKELDMDENSQMEDELEAQEQVDPDVNLPGLFKESNQHPVTDTREIGSKKEVEESSKTKTTQPTEPKITRAGRQTKKPGHLKDYVP